MKIHQKFRSKRSNSFLLIPIMSMAVFGLSMALINPSNAGQGRDATGSNFGYLPIVQHSYPAMTVFGIEPDFISSSTGLNQIVDAQSTWIRKNGLRWIDVEPNEGQIDWAAVDTLDQELRDASSAGLRMILIVQGTPSWAQHPDSLGYSCGPIDPSKLPNFRSFMLQAVAKYSAPPYNVKHFELWNEPDIDPSLLGAPNNNVGCWGDVDDAYYGGGYYADMLATIYQPIKAAYPDTNILVGGLLLDCDPTIPGGCLGPHGAAPSGFLEGILHHNGLNDGGNYFDGISFHAYDFYSGTTGAYANSNWNSSWNTTGPVVNAKIAFMENLLAQFNVSNKFFVNSETALLCDTCNNDPTFETTKAGYLIQNYVAALDQNLVANIWYSLFGWRNSGLVDINLSPKPAYDAYKFSRHILIDSESMGVITSSDVSNTAGVAGYKFDRGDRDIWVLWSKDGNSHQIELLTGQPLAIYDAFGMPITSTITVTVSIEPQFIEWSP